MRQQMGGAFWKQSSVSSHRRSNFKHANNFQFHFSFFLLEGSCTLLPFFEAWADNVVFMTQTIISFSREGMGWWFSGCLWWVPAHCYLIALHQHRVCVTQCFLLFLGRGKYDTLTEYVKGKKPFSQRDAHIYNFVPNFRGFIEALQKLVKPRLKTLQSKTVLLSF